MPGRRTFRAPRLIAVGGQIGSEAGREIGRLHRLVALLDARRNQFFAPIGMLLLWSSNLAAVIERWRRSNGTKMLAWIDAVAEIEALSSLASFAYENPGFALPVIEPGPPALTAEALGHPSGR